MSSRPLECDLKLEAKAIADLRQALAYCEQQADFVSRGLLSQILDAAEAHVDCLETQLGLVEKMGVANYIQSQSA